MISVAKHQQHINLKMLMSYKTFSKIIKHLMLSMLARSHFELVISRVILNSVLKRFHIPSRLTESEVGIGTGRDFGWGFIEF